MTGEGRAAPPAEAAQQALGGPFVIVAEGGSRVPDSPAYGDFGEAARVRDRANRRAALAGRPPAYQVAPASASEAGGP